MVAYYCQPYKTKKDLMLKLLFTALICSVAFSSAVAQSTITVKSKVYLRGAFLGTIEAADDGTPLMKDNLRSHPVTGATYLPAQDPYSVATEYTALLLEKYEHVGAGGDYDHTTITNPGYIFGLTGADAIVDWVFLELRSKWNNKQVVSTRAALVQRDGDIVDLDAESDVTFYDVLPDDYYLVVRHRSHLGAMTADIKTMTELQQGIDFTSPDLLLFDFGTSMESRDYTGLATDTYTFNGQNYRTLWYGDFNADGKVKYDMPMSDLNNLYRDVTRHNDNIDSDTNFAAAYGYLQGDSNMDGMVKYLAPSDDTNLLFSTVQLYPLNEKGDLNFDFFIAQIPY